LTRGDKVFADGEKKTPTELFCPWQKTNNRGERRPVSEGLENEGMIGATKTDHVRVF